MADIPAQFGERHEHLAGIGHEIAEAGIALPGGFGQQLGERQGAESAGFAQIGVVGVLAQCVQNTYLVVIRCVRSRSPRPLALSQASVAQAMR